MIIKTFDSENFCGYKQITTFFQDFSIADAFGANAIKETYKNGLKYAKTDYKVLTEFVMILNWKSWEWAEKNPQYCDLYIDLYYKAYDIAVDTLKDDELSYFFRTTD